MTIIIGILHLIAATLLGYYAIQDYYDRSGSGLVIYQAVMSLVTGVMAYVYFLT